MTTIEIAAGITLTATPATIAALEAEMREYANEVALNAWLRDPANWDDPLYSDIYKDVYGVRPR